MTVASNSRNYRSADVALGILVLAFFVFLSASHDQSFGPLDVDTAYRIAQGLWVVAPIVGGFVARRLTDHKVISDGLRVGFIVGLVVALFPGSGTGEYTCSLNLPAVPMGYMLGRIVVGALVGVGMVIALVTTGVATRRLATAVPGVVIAGAANFLASTAAYELFYGGVRCLP